MAQPPRSAVRSPRRLGDQDGCASCPGPAALRRWLAEPDAPSLEAHIETCRTCQAALDALLCTQSARPGDSAWGGSAETFFERLEAEALTQVGPDAVPDARAIGTEPPALDDYELIEELGRGGMAVVYKARQRELNRLVAIKIVQPGPSATPEKLIRFRREAELAARLHHPHIVQLLEVGCRGRCAFLVMEYLERGALSSRCAGRPQPADESARLVEVLARTVDFMHRQGVVHRDLKPSNILLTADGDPKVADFGLAGWIDLDTELTAPGTLLGTPAYMPPEQVQMGADTVGPAADVYGLGAILYELLTGRPPFTGDSPLDTLFRLRHEDPVPPRRLTPRIPRDLETVTLKCLEKDPARRYTSAEALADDLARVRAGEPVWARHLGPVGRAMRWARRNPVILGLLAAMALLLGMVVVLAAIALSLWCGHERQAALPSFRQDGEDVRMTCLGPAPARFAHHRRPT